MNISRFFGSTNREAMRQVRMALGPDALIISNKRVNGGVEIMAADPTTIPPNTDLGDLAQAADQTARQPSASHASGATPPSSTLDVSRELGAIRGALESRMDELVWGNQMKQSSNTAQLFQMLLGCGFSTSLLRAMLKRLPGGLSLRAAQQWVREQLAKNLPVLANEDDLWVPGLTLALVGPTGVGKTTTIAKLAARAVERHGSGSVALLTTDTYRIGAYEQLKIYAELLKIPVKLVEGADDLVRVLSLIPDRVTVLIDNVGVSQRDRYVAEQAAMLTGTRRNVHRLLVLNASSHGDTLDEVARSYSGDGGVPLQGCIITKADESSSLGAALDTAIRYRLPIHYVSNGQKVPENLLFLNADALVERAMVHEHTTSALYAPSQVDFAALMSASGSLQNPAARTGVDRLLGTLLSGGHNTQETFQENDFYSACDSVEDVLPVAEAWDAWSKLINDSPAVDVATHIERMLQTVRIAGYGRPDSPILAVHTEAPLSLSAGRKGVLRSSLLFNSQGQALISATQQIAVPEGWWASSGNRSQQAPGPAQALAMQVDQLYNNRPDWALLHAFERGSHAFWYELTRKEIPWLARISSVARLVHGQGRSTAMAIAKQLDHQPLAETMVLKDTDASLRVPAVLWVATAPVASTGKTPVAMQMVSVKVISQADGKILKHFLAVVSLGKLALGTPQLAKWLVDAFDARAVVRSAARMNSWNQSISGEHLLPQALYATQLGLASWELQRNPNEITQALHRFSQGMPAGMLSSNTALPKLFALKKWLATASRQ